MKNGFWNIPLAPESRAVTAFIVAEKGHFQFKVMPFGLHSATASCQRVLERVLGADLNVIAFVYLDDVVVLGNSLTEHVKNIVTILPKLYKAKLNINEEKSEFLKTRIQYLGHLVDENGIHTDPENVRAISDMSEPNNVTELRRFTGMISWYRRFISDCSTISQPLNKLLRKKQRWEWGREQANAFSILKEKLVSAPVLVAPDFSRPFVLQTDASNAGLGAVLTQHLSNQDVVIAYTSRALNKSEINNSTTKKECLAVVWAIAKFRYYLEGYTFTVITDHQSLRWLQTIESPAGRIARWVVYLQQFDFEIKYR